MASRGVSNRARSPFYGDRLRVMAWPSNLLMVLSERSGDPMKLIKHPMTPEEVARLIEAIEGLKEPREQRVIEGYFRDGKTMAQIAREMHRSRGRISQVMRAALKHLLAPDENPAEK